MKLTATQKTISRQLRIMFAFEIAHFFQHFVYSVNIRWVVIIRDFALWRFCRLGCVGDGAWGERERTKGRRGEVREEGRVTIPYAIVFDLLISAPGTLKRTSLMTETPRAAWASMSWRICTGDL
jgi:hypothetical protein